MAGRQLKFATGRLLGLALLIGLAAIACGAIALNIADGGRLRGLLRLLGPDGACALMILFTLICALTSLAMLRRLLGDREAAAIRYDGVAIAGMFLSQILPWHDVERICLRAYRYGDKVNFFVKVESRLPAGANAFHHFLARLGYGTAVTLIEGGLEAAEAWVALAEAERAEAIGRRAGTGAARPIAGRAAAAAPVRGFGRRVG